MNIVSRMPLASYPSHFPVLAAHYDLQRNAHWDTGELTGFQQDIEDLKYVSEGCRHIICFTVAFFCLAEGYINTHICEMYVQILIPEIWFCFACQMNMENIHSRTYMLLLLAYCKDNKEFDSFLDEALNSNYVQAKAAWRHKWFSNPHIQVRLCALSCIESIQFSGVFAIPYYYKIMEKRLPALSQIYDLIGRDESNHFCFSIDVIKTLDRLYEKGELALWMEEDQIPHLMPYPLGPEVKTQMITEIVELECDCLRELFSKCECHMSGTPVEALCDYTKSVADQVCDRMGIPRIYNVKNPLDYMRALDVENTTNMFERRVSEYQMSSTDKNITFDSDI